MAQPEIQDTKYGIPRMIYGSDGTNWIAVLVDALGHLQVDVISAALGSGGATEATLLLIKGYVDTLETLLAGGLPAALDTGALKVKEQSPLTGFATSANQTTMITALQLIDDLRAALGSVNTDDLQVDVKTTPGSNALGNFPFGYYDRWNEWLGGVKSGDGPYTVLTTAVPAGYIYVAQFAFMRNVSGARGNSLVRFVPSSNYYTAAYLLAPATAEALVWNGASPLKEGDQIEVRQASCLNGDTIEAGVWGYKMKIA